MDLRLRRHEWWRQVDRRQLGRRLLVGVLLIVVVWCVTDELHICNCYLCHGRLRSRQRHSVAEDRRVGRGTAALIGRPIVSRLGGSLALHNNNNDHERNHDAQSATGRNRSDLPGFQTRRRVHRHRVAVDDDDVSTGINGCLEFSVCRIGNAGR